MPTLKSLYSIAADSIGVSGKLPSTWMGLFESEADHLIRSTDNFQPSRIEDIFAIRKLAVYWSMRLGLEDRRQGGKLALIGEMTLWMTVKRAIQEDSSLYECPLFTNTFGPNCPVGVSDDIDRLIKWKKSIILVMQDAISNKGSNFRVDLVNFMGMHFVSVYFDFFLRYVDWFKDSAWDVPRFIEGDIHKSINAFLSSDILGDGVSSIIRVYMGGVYDKKDTSGTPMVGIESPPVIKLRSEVELLIQRYCANA